jgi:RHS repeat-associated protein
VNHYASESDEPAWIVEDTTAPSNVTRYVSGVEGDIAVSTTATGGRVVQVVDLHGDVVMTIPVADGATVATWADLRVSASYEFGGPLQLTGGGATTGPPARYGWLGAAQRSAETLGGLVLMGARLYSPTLGRFLSVDPVPGGSASAYDYCNADPVNCTDLAGLWGWPKWVTKAASAVAGAARAVASAAVATAKFVWKYRDVIALGLGVAGMFICTLCTVAFYAGMALSVASTASACSKGQTASCAVGIVSTVTGGLGRVGARAGNALWLAGKARIVAGSRTLGPWMSDSGRWIKGVGNVLGMVSTGASGYSAVRSEFG